MKSSNDYDSVFKTMKLKTKRLFIPIINEIFARKYDMDDEVTLLSSECSRVNVSTDGTALKPQLLESDFRIKIHEATYLIEVQSYDDDTIQLRITEYAFLSSLDEAEWGSGWARIKMPYIAIIYIKCGNDLPEYTKILLDFPEDVTVEYRAKNIFLKQLSREYIAINRQYPYIPFYIARYEKELSKGIVPPKAEEDLRYFKERILQDLNDGIIRQDEVMMLIGFTNDIIKHITDGNEIEERMVNIMGGVVLETLYEKAINEGLEQGINKGEELLLIKQVISNKSKGHNALEMTEFLDESLEKIESICAAIGNNDGITAEAVYETLHNSN